jgi:hypothetical protein
MDSRAYIFTFPLYTPQDIPGDFQPFFQGRSFESGVFLPQDDKHWFTRPPEYPARLLLLNRRTLHIIPHPASGMRVIELDLDELVQLETANILLLGWIQFATPRLSERLGYNTRANWAVDGFMAAIRGRWLGEPPPTGTTCSKTFGPELDIKFRNLLHQHLDRDESVLLQCFTPPLEQQKRFLGLKRINWRPGHLIALTSWNRLIWLKDEYQGRWERYAGIAVSAPTPLFQSSRIEAKPEHEEVVICFLSGASWRISLLEAGPDWANFLCALNRCCAPIALKDSETKRIS